MARKEKYIDSYDFGYIEQTRQGLHDAASIALHRKYISKAFHKHGKDTPWNIRLHVISRVHFPKGYFTLEDISHVLTDHYGYNYTNRGAQSRLEAMLEASEWFTRAGRKTWRFKSWARIVGFKKVFNETYPLDLSFLHKSKKKELTDILINIQAAGQDIPTVDVCNQTGYKRARVFEAVGRGHLYNFEKTPIMAPITDTGFKTYKQALHARWSYWHECEIKTDIIEREDGFHLFSPVGNSFKHLRTVANGQRSKRRQHSKLRTVKVNRANGSVFTIQGIEEIKNALTDSMMKVVIAVFNPGERLPWLSRRNDTYQVRRALYV